MNKIRYYNNKVKAIKIVASDGLCKACKCKLGLMGSVFHHIDSNTKLFNISDKLGNIWNNSMEKEIYKCVVLCPNCHNLLHSYIGSKTVTEEDTNDFLNNYKDIANKDIEVLQYFEF